MDTLAEQGVIKSHISKVMICKTKQKSMILNGVSISPYNLQVAGLVKVKILKQQINLLTSKIVGDLGQVD